MQVFHDIFKLNSKTEKISFKNDADDKKNYENFCNKCKDTDITKRRLGWFDTE